MLHGCTRDQPPVRIGLLVDCFGAARNAQDAVLAGGQLPLFKQCVPSRDSWTVEQHPDDLGKDDQPERRRSRQKATGMIKMVSALRVSETIRGDPGADPVDDRPAEEGANDGGQTSGKQYRAGVEDTTSALQYRPWDHQRHDLVGGGRRGLGGNGSAQQGSAQDCGSNASSVTTCNSLAASRTADT
jgi:hypothetical protein